jgi:hypothetical protein
MLSVIMFPFWFCVGAGGAGVGCVCSLARHVHHAFKAHGLAAAVFVMAIGMYFTCGARQGFWRLPVAELAGFRRDLAELGHMGVPGRPGSCKSSLRTGESPLHACSLLHVVQQLRQQVGYVPHLTSGRGPAQHARPAMLTPTCHVLPQEPWMDIPPSTIKYIKSCVKELVVLGFPVGQAVWGAIFPQQHNNDEPDAIPTSIDIHRASSVPNSDENAHITSNPEDPSPHSSTTISPAGSCALEPDTTPTDVPTSLSSSYRTTPNTSDGGSSTSSLATTTSSSSQGARKKQATLEDLAAARARGRAKAAAERAEEAARQKAEAEARAARLAAADAAARANRGLQQPGTQSAFAWGEVSTGGWGLRNMNCCISQPTQPAVPVCCSDCTTMSIGCKATGVGAPP